MGIRGGGVVCGRIRLTAALSVGALRGGESAGCEQGYRYSRGYTHDRYPAPILLKFRPFMTQRHAPKAISALPQSRASRVQALAVWSNIVPIAGLSKRARLVTCSCEVRGCLRAGGGPETRFARLRRHPAARTRYQMGLQAFADSRRTSPSSAGQARAIAGLTHRRLELAA